VDRPIRRTSDEKAPPRDRSIAFGKDMIGAILAGRKTQTRRLMKVDRDGAAGPSPGAVGETLWVRERFASVVDREGVTKFIYAADGTPHTAHKVRWQMSIHMPRRASRMSVRVSGVRSERLQEISDADVLAEGCPGDRLVEPLAWFRQLWDGLSPDGAKWTDNPAVWVLDFERIAPA
jgi:hypothetical protein